MRICYLVADHGIPVLGRKGCSTHVRETCRGLSEAGHDVTVYTTNRGTDESVDPGLRIREVAPFRQKWLGADVRMMLNSRALFRAMRHEFAIERPEVIYERYSLYTMAGLMLAKKFRIPRILEVNAHLVEEQRDRLHFPWLAHRFERHLLRSAEELIVVSHPLMNSFLKLGLNRDNITVMPMAVDINRFRPDVPPKDVRKTFGISKNLVAGYVGTLTQWHGIDMLYSVAERFRKENIDCALLVLGGDQRQVQEHRNRVIHSRLTDYLSFAGSVPYTDVPAYISAMDITLIANSTKFASPTKLFEYQAMGKPSVAPNLVPIREAVAHDEDGLLFEPGNIPDLVECLMRLAGDPERRRAMGRRARERVVKTHSWEANVERIVDLYDKMLDKRIVAV